MIIVNFAENRGDVKISIQIRLCFPRWSKIIPRCAIFMLWPFPEEGEKRRNFRISHRQVKTKFAIDEIVYLSWFLSAIVLLQTQMDLGCCCKRHFSDKNLLTFAHLGTILGTWDDTSSQSQRIKTGFWENNGFVSGAAPSTHSRVFSLWFSFFPCIFSIRRLVCSVIGHLLYSRWGSVSSQRTPSSGRKSLKSRTRKIARTIKNLLNFSDSVERYQHMDFAFELNRTCQFK